MTESIGKAAAGCVRKKDERKNVLVTWVAVACLVTIGTNRVMLAVPHPNERTLFMGKVSGSVNVSNGLQLIDDAAFSPAERTQRTFLTTASLLPATVEKASFPTDNDNKKIPGLFMNDKLHILGVRLTTSYEKLDTSVSFDMFAGAVGEGATSKAELDVMDPAPQLSYKEASQQNFYCQVSATERVRMELAPIESIDGNVAGAHLIWRCNVSPHLSRSKMLASEGGYVRVSVFAEEGSPHVSNSTGPILIVDIPFDTSHVGDAGPIVKSNSQPPILKMIDQQGPLSVVLCVAGLQRNAITVLPEFIQHHLNVGAEQIILGATSWEEMVYFEEKLAYFINEGSVLLGMSHDVHNVLNVPFGDDVLKMRFYDQCLYYAKGVSEFLAIWDVDELWMPPMDAYKNHEAKTSQTKRQISMKSNRGNPNALTAKRRNKRIWRQSPYRRAMSLAKAAHSLSGKDGCKDWCYQTFPSYTMIPMIGREALKDGYGGFPLRETRLNNVWQKPIIRTKYAHSASFHVGGSCRKSALPAQGMADNAGDDLNLYTAMFEACPLWERPNAALGSMHHYMDLFRGRDVDRDSTDLDEYTAYMRPTILTQLENLQSHISEVEQTQ